MAITFRYRQIGTRGSPIKRPLIPVKMSNGTNSISVMALLDSGADSTAISSNMAETLDLDTSGSRKRSYGVAGSIESVSSEVALTIGNNHESYSLNVPVRVYSLMNQRLVHLYR